MLSDQSLYLVKLPQAEPMISCQSNRVKPEFRFVLACFDMNMGRLTIFVAEKEEPVRANFENSWHSVLTTCGRRE